MQTPRCQHALTFHSYARSLVLCSSRASSCLTCPPSRSRCMYYLTEKHTKWKWEEPQQIKLILKQKLTNNTVLAHFDPSCPVRISCDASESGVGAVLFHRYKDNSERPIANASKTLTDAQKRYPQIQKEALSIIFALKKYYQFLYGRPFILVTDHNPLISMFGLNSATPMLAANRLAR